MVLSEILLNYIHSNYLFGLNLKSDIILMLMFSFLLSNSCLHFMHNDKAIGILKAKRKRQAYYIFRWFINRCTISLQQQQSPCPLTLHLQNKGIGFLPPQPVPCQSAILTRVPSSHFLPCPLLKYIMLWGCLHVYFLVNNVQAYTVHISSENLPIIFTQIQINSINFNKQ